MQRAIRPEVEDAHRIAKTLRPILKGYSPAVQEIVLADLLATFIAGHHPGLREKTLDIHIQHVRALVPVNEAEIFATRERPPDWEVLMKKE